MLYVVATPIGNLEDITIRALKIFKKVDFILCEDTRQTKKLLDYYKITTPTISYHQHSQPQKVNYILSLLDNNKNLAIVCDAGTPGISDPGNKLISLITKKFIDLAIIPIPGPSALIAALSISGFPTDKFIFWGFPPNKKGRQKFFKEISKTNYTSVFYESPYRILKALKELNNLIPNREIVIARELTKKFETIYRGEIKSVFNKSKNIKIKGEFVVVINKI